MRNGMLQPKVINCTKLFFAFCNSGVKQVAEALHLQ